MVEKAFALVGFGEELKRSYKNVFSYVPIVIGYVMARTKRAITTASNKFVRGKTRGGGEIRIYDDDAGGDYPIHGSWWYEAEKRWIPAAWTKEGFVVEEDQPRQLDIAIKTLKF